MVTPQNTRFEVQWKYQYFDLKNWSVDDLFGGERNRNSNTGSTFRSKTNNVTIRVCSKI